MKESQPTRSTGLPDRLLNSGLSRRAFLGRLALVAGESVVALACGPGATAVPTLSPRPPAEPSPSTEPSPTAEPLPMIEAGPVEFQANGDNLLGYLSRPTSPGPHPGVLVVHENRGLLSYFADVTRHLAAEGYVALAVDMLSRQGGTDSFPDTDAMRSALSVIPISQIVEDENAGVQYLQSQPYVTGNRVGAMGFCFGEGIV